MGATSTDLRASWRAWPGRGGRPDGMGPDRMSARALAAAVATAAVAVAMAIAVAVSLWPSGGGLRETSGAAAGALRTGAKGASPGAGHAAGSSLAAGAGVGGVEAGASAADAAAAGGTAAGGATGSGSSAPPAATALAQSKVIENGQIGLQVVKGSVTSTVNALTLLAAEEGGFVAASAESSSSGGPDGSVTLRIPNGSFADALAKVRAMGKVQSTNVTGQDVTAQYQDLSDQITALRQAQSQYLTIMTRANSVGDILAVQGQINNVDSQLQQLEGQQKVLDDQTTYATLAVSVGQPGGPVPRPVPTHGPWARAFLGAANGFSDGMQGLISASGALAFALLVGAAVGLAGLVIWRRYLRPIIPAPGQ
jgi:hypothetical protein